MHTNFWWTNLKYRDHLEDLGIDGRILNWILRNCDGGGMWNVLVESGYGQVAGFYERL